MIQNQITLAHTSIQHVTITVHSRQQYRRMNVIESLKNGRIFGTRVDEEHIKLRVNLRIYDPLTHQ